jgi:hypothetical protein
LRYPHLPAHRIHNKGRNITRDVRIINNEVPPRNETATRPLQALLLFHSCLLNKMLSYFKTVSSNSLSSFSQTFLLAGPFWPRKITNDRHIFAHAECRDDR